MNSVSVIIPTLNAGPRFPALLHHLQRQEISAAVEIIVIDSSSTDATPDVARTAGAALHSIPRNQFNHGATRNFAISRSSGQFVFLLSQDVMPTDAFLLARLLNNFADPSVAGAFARHQPRPDHPFLIQQHTQRWAGSPLRQESFIQSPADYHRLSSLQRLAFCRFDNACSALRRCVWDAFPFAARDFAEDLEWSQTVLEAGHKIVYDPAVSVIHSHHFSLRQEYQRVWKTHRALRELFGVQVISHRHELPRRLWHHMRDQFRAIAQSPLRFPRKMWDALGVPAHSLACVLATYKGAQQAPSPRRSCPAATSDNLTASARPSGKRPETSLASTSQTPP